LATISCQEFVMSVAEYLQHLIHPFPFLSTSDGSHKQHVESDSSLSDTSLEPVVNSGVMVNPTNTVEVNLVRNGHMSQIVKRNVSHFTSVTALFAHLDRLKKSLLLIESFLCVLDEKKSPGIYRRLLKKRTLICTQLDDGLKQSIRTTLTSLAVPKDTPLLSSEKEFDSRDDISSSKMDWNSSTFSSSFTNPQDQIMELMQLHDKLKRLKRLVYLYHLSLKVVVPLSFPLSNMLDQQ
jgi:hypothetical protein